MKNQVCLDCSNRTYPNNTLEIQYRFQLPKRDGTWQQRLNPIFSNIIFTLVFKLSCFRLPSVIWLSLIPNIGIGAQLNAGGLTATRREGASLRSFVMPQGFPELGVKAHLDCCQSIEMGCSSGEMSLWIYYFNVTFLGSVFALSSLSWVQIVIHCCVRCDCTLNWWARGLCIQNVENINFASGWKTAVDKWTGQRARELGKNRLI